MFMSDLAASVQHVLFPVEIDIPDLDGFLKMQCNPALVINMTSFQFTLGKPPFFLILQL